MQNDLLIMTTMICAGNDDNDSVDNNDADDRDHDDDNDCGGGVK